jgi:hypothetical protein
MSVAQKIFELSDERFLQDVGISKFAVCLAVQHEENGDSSQPLASRARCSCLSPASLRRRVEKAFVVI